MPLLELFGAASCPHTRELREWLEWRGRDFLEYDVERDRGAFERLRALTGGQSMVPVLIEDGKLLQSGWQGRGCVVSCTADSRAPRATAEDPHA
ncbi:MAG TPA: glutaredoxin family protein [Bryobacteraceae bacterium]|nr:glutaredoxin family protein [Bryobacteraceae bacterium]